MPNETEKRKFSPLSKISLFCALGYMFIIYNLKWTTTSSFFLKVTSISAVIIGIAALLHIHISKKKLIGKVFAIVGIIIGLSPLANLLAIPAYYQARKEVCKGNVVYIGEAIKRYASAHDGKFLPEPDRWCDLLKEQKEWPDRALICSAANISEKNKSCYAINEKVIGMKLSDIPPNVVLFFDSKVGWNQIGGQELLEGYHKWGDTKHAIVLLADFSVVFVKEKDFSSLRWEP